MNAPAVLASLFLSSVALGGGEPTELRLPIDAGDCSRSSAEILRGEGLASITLFIEGDEVCTAAALRVAARALLTAVGREHPAQLATEAGDQGCDAACWFNRPSAVVAGPHLARTIWPEPPPTVPGTWLFFATSPDLSSHWHWIGVTVEDGEARVLVWSERE